MKDCGVATRVSKVPNGLGARFRDRPCLGSSRVLVLLALRTGPRNSGARTVGNTLFGTNLAVILKGDIRSFFGRAVKLSVVDVASDLASCCSDEAMGGSGCCCVGVKGCLFGSFVLATAANIGGGRADVKFRCSLGSRVNVSS